MDRMDTPPIPSQETPDERDVRMNKEVAAFSYIWIMSLVVLAARRDSKFAQFHAKQGLVLFLLSIPVWLIPIFGHFITIILVAGMVFGFINAAQGKYADVPFAGPLSRGELSLGDIKAMVKHVVHEISHLFGEIFKKKEKSADSSHAEPPATPPPTQVP